MISKIISEISIKYVIYSIFSQREYKINTVVDDCFGILPKKDKPISFSNLLIPKAETMISIDNEIYCTVEETNRIRKILKMKELCSENIYIKYYLLICLETSQYIPELKLN